MRTLIVITILVSLVASQLQDNLEAKGTKDMITGFMLAMRAAEKIPDAFDCATNAVVVVKAMNDAKAELKKHDSVVHVVKTVMALVKSIKTAQPGCVAVAHEGKDYVTEIKEIVTAQTFAGQAALHLFKYRTNVVQDVKDYKEAKAEEQFLVAGMKLGEIGRIILWGSPAE